MKTVTRVADLRREVAAARRTDRSDAAPVIALVPTMGALHAGHIALMDRARELADIVVLSVFVNPIQFGPGEDFDRYPRDLARDAELAERRGVEVLFAPTPAEVYPAGEPEVKVTPGRLADGLCGAARPGHFQGVLTVVAKLFGMAQPDVAVFGRKDYQQAALVRQMVVDLNMPVRVEVAPTVREADGLALSSRNAFLSEVQRARARSLSAGLFAARDTFADGVTDIDRLKARVRGIMRDADVEPEYIELVDPDTLDPLREAVAGAVMAVAARVGDTRLIDNVVLGSNE